MAQGMGSRLDSVWPARRADDAPATQRLQAAREKVAGYDPALDEPVCPAPQQAPVRRAEEWTDLVSQRIEEAMRAGAFDNLPGRGKPLNLNREPFVPDGQQMAFKLLENNRLTPAWIGEHAELRAKVESLRGRLARSVARRRSDLQAATSAADRENQQARWQPALAGFAEEIRQLNKQILTLNLKRPVAHLELCQLRLDEELERLGGVEPGSATDRA